ncbi:MAG: hypothetical protein ACJ8CR_32915, partial [Roseiflexaceae bacterium]
MHPHMGLFRLLAVFTIAGLLLSSAPPLAAPRAQAMAGPAAAAVAGPAMPAVVGRAAPAAGPSRLPVESRPAPRAVDPLPVAPSAASGVFASAPASELASSGVAMPLQQGPLLQRGALQYRNDFEQAIGSAWTTTNGLGVQRLVTPRGNRH